MFAIYNTNGCTFRDRLEVLKKVKKPGNVKDISLQENVSQDDTTIIQGNTNGDTPNKRKIATYRSMLNANERAIIVHAYQIMSHPVVTMNNNINVKQAYEHFQNHSFNQIPVNDSQLNINV